jgi:hypothetical protein
LITSQDKDAGGRMNALDNLRRLRYQDPQAAAVVVEALWEQLAREDPRMFHALWRRAARRMAMSAPKPVAVPAVEWLDELPPLTVTAQRLPGVDLADRPRSLVELEQV